MEKVHGFLASWLKPYLGIGVAVHGVAGLRVAGLLFIKAEKWM